METQHGTGCPCNAGGHTESAARRTSRCIVQHGAHVHQARGSKRDVRAGPTGAAKEMMASCGFRITIAQKRTVATAPAPMAVRVELQLARPNRSAGILNRPPSVPEEPLVLHRHPLWTPRLLAAHHRGPIRHGVRSFASCRPGPSVLSSSGWTVVVLVGESSRSPGQCRGTYRKAIHRCETSQQ